MVHGFWQLANSVVRSCTVSRRMAERLKDVDITADHARQLAECLNVSDTLKYAEITKLGVVCQQALDERLYEPQDLVEALIITRGLGRYVKGLVCEFYLILVAMHTIHGS